MTNEELMLRAIQLSTDSVQHHGGPFGAVVAKAGAIVAEASNSVTLSHDPTAHAEVNAIRLAAKALGTHDLSGCDIYCSCEPCPMCLGAIYWAHIDHIFYACTHTDAAGIGFDDALIYREMALPAAQRHKPMTMLLRQKALAAFELWQEDEEKERY